MGLIFTILLALSPVIHQATNFKILMQYDFAENGVVTTPIDKYRQVQGTLVTQNGSDIDRGLQVIMFVVIFVAFILLLKDLFVWLKKYFLTKT